MIATRSTLLALLALTGAVIVGLSAAQDDATSGEESASVSASVEKVPLRIGAAMQQWTDCDDYLTRNSSEGHCESSPPPDWRPFMFEGKRYYIVPLAENDGAVSVSPTLGNLSR